MSRIDQIEIRQEELYFNEKLLEALKVPQQYRGAVSMRKTKIDRICESAFEFKIVPGESENELNARWEERRKTIGACILSLARSLQMFCVWADLEASCPE